MRGFPSNGKQYRRAGSAPAMRPTLMPRRGTVSSGTVNKGSSEASTYSATPLATTSSGAVPISKFAACYQAIFSGSEKPQPYTKEDPERFYSDLFCLRIDTALLKHLVEQTKDDQLVESGNIKNNIRELFFYAVKCLKVSEADDPRLSNVIETLHITLRSILSRPLPNYSVDIMSLLAGSIDQADVVFPDLVTAVDGILQNAGCEVNLKERAISLTLLIVTSIDQGSINSYFLRRDLFSSVAKLVSETATAHMTADAFLMLGVLANYHKYEARNAMLVRFEDLVDETIMKRLRETAASTFLLTRDAYVARVDDSPPTLFSNVTSLVSSLRLLASSPPVIIRTTSTGSVDGLLSPGAREESVFADMPLGIAAILLPIYDLVNSNKAFSSFLLNDRADASTPEPDFIATLISLSSYLFTHAAVSKRSQLYSRLALIIVTILVEEAGSIFIPADQGFVLRLCRQRQPTLPNTHDVKRPIFCSILDSLALFLRFNLVRKRFDVDSHLLALRLVHKIMHQLKSCRTRLDYDWQPLHQALLSLAHFLVSRQSDLGYLPRIEDLVTQVLLTIDFAVVWADVILPNTEAFAYLLYEILRAEDTLTKLGTLTTLANMPAPPLSPRLGPSSPSTRRNSMSPTTNGSVPSSPTVKSPALTPAPSFAAAMSFGATEAVGPAAESVRNLGVVRSHFGGKVDDFKEKTGTTIVESYQVLNIIKSSLDGLDLRESMALEDGGIRRYTEADHEPFFLELVHIASKDILKLTTSK